MAMFDGAKQVERGDAITDFRGDTWEFASCTQTKVYVKNGESTREFNAAVFPALRWEQTKADDEADRQRELYARYGPFRFKIDGLKVVLSGLGGEQLTLYSDEFGKLQNCLDAALEAVEESKEAD